MNKNTAMIKITGESGVATLALILADALHRLGRNPVYFGMGGAVITHDFRTMIRNDSDTLLDFADTLTDGGYDTFIMHSDSVLCDRFDIACTVSVSDDDCVTREYIRNGIVYCDITVDGHTYTTAYTRATANSCVAPAVRYIRSFGYSAESIARVLPHVRSVGRLYPNGSKSGVGVLIDCARDRASLDYVLGEYARLFPSLTVVIGSVGMRYEERRIEIAEILNKYRPHVILTSDDPTYEDPKRICDYIAAHLTYEINVTTVLDRGEAIRMAIGNASAGSCVLILGKGYENVQIIGNRRTPFDDIAVAKIVTDEKDRQL